MPDERVRIMKANKRIGGKLIMTRKENLVYTMRNLMEALKKHLEELDAGDIDEAVYEDLNSELFFVQEALRLYFDENYYDRPKKITMLKPDGEIHQYYE